MSRTKVPCPVCTSKGEDRSGDNLSLYNSGKGGYCFKCAKTVWLNEESSINQYEKRPANLTSELDLQVVSKYPITGIPSRGISKETAERYEIRSSVDEVTGEQDAVYYPYFNHDGYLSGYKKRKLPKQFSVIGKPTGMFGQHQCKKGAKFLILVEGEHDVLAVWEMLSSLGKNYNVVSLPNGANEAGAIDKQTLKEIEWITSHDTIAICLDSDEPGKATAKALADHLVSQVKVGIVTLPMKDAGEMHANKMAKEFFKALQDAKPYRPESVVEGSTIDLDELMKPKEPGVELPYPVLQRMTWGVRKGEITLITGGSGLGKSTLTREVGHHLAKNKGMKVATIGLETVMEDSARYYIAIDNNVPAHKLMFNPQCIPKEDYAKSFKELITSNKMHFFKHWGSIDSEDLIRKCQYFAKALDCDFIILDHISMVVAGQHSKDERKDIDTLFEALARLVTETGVGVIAVMHLKRVSGKSFNQGGEVELSDLRGSSGAECMSFNVWALERDQQGEQKDLMKIRVLKNRLLGFTGLADTLRYDHVTGRLETMNNDY